MNLKKDGHSIMNHHYESSLTQWIWWKMAAQKTTHSLSVSSFFLYTVLLLEVSLAKIHVSRRPHPILKDILRGSALKGHLLQTSKTYMLPLKASFKSVSPLTRILFDDARMLLDVEPIPNMKYYGINQNEWPQSKLLADKKVATEGAHKRKTKSEIAGNGKKSKNGQSKNKKETHSSK